MGRWFPVGAIEGMFTDEDIQGVFRNTPFQSIQGFVVWLSREHPEHLTSPPDVLAQLIQIEPKVLKALKYSPTYRKAMTSSMIYDVVDPETQRKNLQAIADIVSSEDDSVSAGDKIKAQTYLDRQMKILEPKQVQEERSVSLTISYIPAKPQVVQAHQVQPVLEDAKSSGEDDGHEPIEAQYRPVLDVNHSRVSPNKVPVSSPRNLRSYADAKVFATREIPNRILSPDDEK